MRTSRAWRHFQSRLFTGTGKYPTMELMQKSIERSDCDMVTVAVRRVQSVAAGHAARALSTSLIIAACILPGCRSNMTKGDWSSLCG